MVEDRGPKEQDMSAILASIRRMVAEEDRFARPDPLPDDTVLDLTPEMRLMAPPEGEGVDLGTEAIELSIDEAQIADIARAVLREEFAGAFGRELTRKLRLLVREEVAQAIDALGDRR